MLKTKIAISLIGTIPIPLTRTNALRLLAGEETISQAGRNPLFAKRDPTTFEVIRVFVKFVQ
jgi:hypothetical protein